MKPEVGQLDLTRLPAVARVLAWWDLQTVAPELLQQAVNRGKFIVGGQLIDGPTPTELEMMSRMVSRAAAIYARLTTQGIGPERKDLEQQGQLSGGFTHVDDINDSVVQRSPHLIRKTCLECANQYVFLASLHLPSTGGCADLQEMATLNLVFESQFFCLFWADLYAYESLRPIRAAFPNHLVRATILPSIRVAYGDRRLDVETVHNFFRDVFVARMEEYDTLYHKHSENTGRHLFERINRRSMYSWLAFIIDCTSPGLLSIVRKAGPEARWLDMPTVPPTLFDVLLKWKWNPTRTIDALGLQVLEVSGLQVISDCLAPMLKILRDEIKQSTR